MILLNLISLIQFWNWILIQSIIVTSPVSSFEVNRITLAAYFLLCSVTIEMCRHAITSLYYRVTFVVTDAISNIGDSFSGSRCSNGF